ncbi:MAG TPA: hypothetical protein VN740_02355 [Solirubrobacteraceae bacterium]|nr:hypothetical protein [Solirubrobacteraceae bacterium]
MTSRPARVFIAVLAAWSLAGTAVAYAHTSPFNKSVRAALRDCATNDPLKGHYSLKVLQTALKDVKAEALQYTGCADVLIAAIHKQSLGTPPKVPSHHSVIPSKVGRVTKPSKPVIVKQGQKAIRNRVDRLQSEGGSPLKLPSGQTVTPGAVVTHSASFLSTLPTPLAIVLAALLAAVVAVSGRALHNVVRARRSR